MISTKKLAAAGIGASLLALAATIPAYADYGPSASDVVGVGGDTPQYDLDFLANGDANGNLGFNSANLVNKWVPFDATADANGRQAYANGSTESSVIPLNPTVVLRAGSTPVQRPQSSGAAINALLADTGSQETINYVASASLPSSAQQATAASNGWGYLHVVQLGTDNVEIAASTNTNAPAGLSAKDLLNIYTGAYKTWSDVPGYSGSAGSDAIIPELPPSGSSINKLFLSDLKTANNGTAPTLAGTVKIVEQNDPSAITGSSSPDDAIVPFSAGRLSLYQNNYFHDPTTGNPISAGVKLLNGQTPETGHPAAYTSTVTHYIIFRQTPDATSTTPMEPGGSLNWVETLFSENDPNSTVVPYVESLAGEALLTSAGITPDYEDLGNVHS